MAFDKSGRFYAEAKLKKEVREKFEANKQEAEEVEPKPAKVEVVRNDSPAATALSKPEAVKSGSK